MNENYNLQTSIEFFYCELDVHRICNEKHDNDMVEQCDT